ncbi:hypothetical protein [Enterobacter ludwigii]|uniref:hypothetical protein n=1 Tax=Enterobacter ludwigii TaxID=299767 RepID=UPI003F71562B
MELTERECEVLAGFIEENWEMFSDQAEEFLGVNGLHRLAEKLNLNSGTVSNKPMD